MDINCAHKCYYQCEGKCTLNQLMAFSQSISTTEDMDCPYYTAASELSYRSTGF